MQDLDAIKITAPKKNGCSRYGAAPYNPFLFDNIRSNLRKIVRMKSTHMLTDSFNFNGV